MRSCASPWAWAISRGSFYTTRCGEGGSGLGLHIVYNLVTQVLCGRIDCESANGRGTCFHIR